MADIANRNDAPSKKKIFYPIKNPLKNYLLKYDREVAFLLLKIKRILRRSTRVKTLLISKYLLHNKC